MRRRGDGDPAVAAGSGAVGFTLLEVLVALVILSGTLLLCYRVGSSALGAAGGGEERYRAALLGEATLRQTLDSFPPVGRTEGVYAAPDDSFRYVVVVSDAVHKDLREVHVIVSWDGPAGEMKVDVPGVASR